MKRHDHKNDHSGTNKTHETDHSDIDTDAENVKPNPSENVLPDAETAESDPMAKMEAELSEVNDKYLRLYSEFENFKKRVARDRVDLARYATSDVFLAILPVIDDFERAINNMPPQSKPDPVADGIRLIYQKLVSITEAKGLKKMDATGKVFDAELHDAITNMPATSPADKGKVLQEVENGYFLNDKVLRHAKVIVGA